MSDTCVQVRHLSKHFLVLKQKKTALRVLKALIKCESLKREHWVLRDVSFKVNKGDKLAIIGRNGSGKTTLLRILTGIYAKTSGNLQIEGRPRALFNSWIGLIDELSVMDNIYLFGAIHEIGRNVLEHKVQKILEMAELSHLQFASLKDLSLGQRQRFALSVFFQTQSDFLIFDEALANVDSGFMQTCEQFFHDLLHSDKTVIMTSHNASFLRKYCQTALWLEEGYIRLFGEVEEVMSEYEQAVQV